MNMRQHRKNRALGMFFTVYLRGLSTRPYIPEVGVVLMAEAAEASLYKVARVKDDVVVLETESREEAQEAIDKAARQKKAKLYLVDGEPFGEFTLGDIAVTAS